MSKKHLCPLDQFNVYLAKHPVHIGKKKRQTRKFKHYILRVKGNRLSIREKRHSETYMDNLSFWLSGNGVTSCRPVEISNGLGRSTVTPGKYVIRLAI